VLLVLIGRFLVSREELIVRGSDDRTVMAAQEVREAFAPSAMLHRCQLRER